MELFRSIDGGTTRMRPTRSLPLASGRRALLALAGKAAVAAAGAVALAHAPAAAQESSSAGLTGTWLLNTPPPAGEFAPVRTIATFIPGGAFIPAGAMHRTETPGHGAWVQVGENEYDITYMTVQLDDAGNFIGNRKTFLRATMDPSGMRFTARVRTRTIDAQGVESEFGAEAMNGGVRLAAGPYPDVG